MNAELPEADNRRLYLKTWQRVLEVFLGWNKQDVTEWARQYENGLNGVDPVFYRETSIHYVVPLLIPERLQQRLEWHGLLQLKDRIEQTIQMDFHADLPNELAARKQSMPLFDWLREFEQYREQAIQRGNWFAEVNSETFDWHSAKQRVQRILAEYGEELRRRRH